jgi:phage terminase large subunit GpA-like protein
MLARQSSITLPSARPELYRVLADALRPRPVVRVSQWADTYRVLSSKGSAEPGRWDTSRTPFLRDIMDALSITSVAQRVVVMSCAQVGKTEIGLNWLGYIMEHAPAPTLVAVPTLEVRKRWVRQRLDPMLTETPVLRDLLDARRSRDAGNSEDLKDFPGGMLVIGGANSPASLASMPICNVLCDELDRFPWEVGQEGDPLGLIDERTKAFPRRKVLLVSTPTVKGQSRIEQEYLASDQRQFHVPCPHCYTPQVLRWRHDDGNYGLIHHSSTGEVFYACRECGSRIDEHHKPAMLERGVWIPKYPERDVRGYHINGLYAPLGLGFTWHELWSEWQRSHGDTSRLKRFVNTTLGETWEEQGESVDGLALIARLEEYPVSLPVRDITAGADVQKDRIEVSIIGWRDEGEEGWALSHLVLDGDTTEPAVWDELHQVLTEARVQHACIDSGYNTSMVYAFCDKRRWCTATKGVTGMGRPLIEDERKRAQRLRTRRRKGAPLEPVGVDQGKAILYARLKLTQAGPGYMHFPNTPDFDDEYFAQLAAEKLVTKARHGRPYQEWVQTRPRNEALDCMLLALVARRLLPASRKPGASPAADAPKIIKPPAGHHLTNNEWANKL